MTDLFVAVSTGRPMGALELPPNLPSYLFSEERLAGFVKINYALNDAPVEFYARLGFDAMYLFKADEEAAESREVWEVKATQAASLPTTSKPAFKPPHNLVACIPLEFVHVLNQSGMDDFGDRVELVSVNAKQLPVIHFNHQEYRQSLAVQVSAHSADAAKPPPKCVWLGAKSVAHHDSISIVPVLPNESSSGPHARLSIDERITLWVDALENSSWDCRARARKALQVQK